MHGIGESCRRYEALGRFLDNRRGDVRSRLHLADWRRYGEGRVIFQAPRTGQNGRTNLPHQSA